MNARSFSYIHAPKPTTAFGQRATHVCYARRFKLKSIGDGDLTHLDDVPGDLSEITDLDLDEGVLELGRVEDADITVGIPTVSARHAMLRVTGDSVFVTDLGSTNGTFVGKSQLKPMEAAPLGVGEAVTFGDPHLARFQLCVVEIPSEEAQTASQEMNMDM